MQSLGTRFGILAENRSSFILRATYPQSSVTPPLAGPSGRRPPGMWRSPEPSPGSGGRHGFCLSRSCWTIDHSSSIGFRSRLFPGHSSFAQECGRLSRHHCWAVAERRAGTSSFMKMVVDLSAIDFWPLSYLVGS